MKTLSKNESDMLVAIAKLETKLDSMQAKLEEVSSGALNRLLNLESNAVSKIQVDADFEKVNQKIADLSLELERQTTSSHNWRWLFGIALPLLAGACFWLWTSYYQFTTTNDARIQRDINTNLINYGLIKN